MSMTLKIIVAAFLSCLGAVYLQGSGLQNHRGEASGFHRSEALGSAERAQAGAMPVSHPSR